MKKRVVLGLSGGVDSSVAAYLLKEKGYEVIGLFMKNWHDDSVTISEECPWLQDSNDAMMVAEHLKIPYQTVDLSEVYKKRIVDRMFSEYQNGRTPNPDVLCNKEIKFDVFLKIALDLGADYVATGHYCRKIFYQKQNKNMYRLLAGKDNEKDQSYFLCRLSQYQLSKALFPLGDLTKKQVRKIAKKQRLITANKKDSQGLCFVGKVKLPAFLQQKLKPKKGKIVAIDNENIVYKTQKNFENTIENLQEFSKNIPYKITDGKIIGTHMGAYYFTIGQRKGLAVGGKQEPLYVIGTDVSENIVYVGQGKNHKGLYKKVLFVKKENEHWLREDLKIKENENKDFLVRTRYRQHLQNAILYAVKNGIFIAFEKPQFAITQGQFVVWYENEELIGSGVIA